MYQKVLILFMLTLSCSRGVETTRKTGTNETSNKVFSEAYQKIWNSQMQEKIDGDIEKYRKADAIIKFKNIPSGTEVKIEQISHDFIFGGNIFLYGDLKSPEKNRKYENTFGTLFNAATVPFYWKTLEPEAGKPRYKEGSSYEFRRPPTDPVVAFCKARGINMNGHAIIYGLRSWGHPTWMPEDRNLMENYFKNHVKELAERYKGQIQRWDVVNEPIDQANRGIMPDDYTFKSFAWAMKYFPDSVKLNINDTDLHWEITDFRRYMELVRNLIARGTRINYVGIQMHIFNPEESAKIAEGANVLTPTTIFEKLDCMSETERPLHISEVTVSAPDDTDEGKLIQAGIAKNLYRLWFSHPKVMGITWWNVADGGAAPGEPSLSGLYDKELNPKPAYHALNKLINNEWKTQINTKADDNGMLKFRGFKGKYKVTWKDESGNDKTTTFYLKQDGDGVTVVQ